MSEVGHQQERSESPVDRRSEVGGVMPHNRKQVKGGRCGVMVNELRWWWWW